METATVEPGNDPMHEQNQRKDPQRERRLLAARLHAFAQEVRIERRERNDHDDDEDCEIRPKARDGDRAGRCEQCDGRGDHEKGCLEVSRDWHPLLYHFRGSEVVPHMALAPDKMAYRARREARAYFSEGIVWRIGPSAQRLPRLRTACSASFRNQIMGTSNNGGF